MEAKKFRVMALDYGNVRIGIAISDLTWLIASGLENYDRKGIKNDILHIKNLINENNVGIIVVGLPLNMDGSKSEQTLRTLDFVELLKQEFPALQIDVFDERLTSMAAEKFLISADVSRDKRKQVLDKMSATIILQDYLNSKN